MSQPKTVYILHKNGADSHYKGLKFLVNENGGKLVYREFSITGTFVKSILKLNFARAWKQVINAAFLLKLKFTKNEKVVLGIAPFDYKFPFIYSFLKNHEVFYHTSWTVWDGSHHPKRKRITAKLLQQWKKFLEHDAKHIFAVSGETKKQLMANYAITDSRINVVYHSLNEKVFCPYPEVKKDDSNLRFIYAGRLVEQKGLKELLDYFAGQEGKTLTIAGNGELKNLVEEYAAKHASIQYVGYVKDPAVLAQYYREHHYLLLNSHKTAKWEEVFGMVLIEAMACGVVPVSTNHTGPVEIITNGVNGYLVPEGSMAKFIDTLTTDNIDKLQEEAIKSTLPFYESNIANRWKPVLNN